MAELKTKETDQSVAKFLDSIDDEQQRKDCKTIAKIMRQVTKAKPKMWGSSMVGFGSYHFKYASGREGDWFQTGFAPRKRDLTLYIMSGFSKHDALMRKLGKHKPGKSCLYVKKLEDVDIGVLTDLIQQSVKHVKQSQT